MTPMPTDPATVPPLTEQEIGHFRHEYRTTGISFETVARNIYALAASRVDSELKDKRDKVMHMHDLYDALGVEWGRDPFSAIAVLKASQVDTAEVERRAKYEALTKARSIAMRPGTWEQVDDRLKAAAEKYATAPAPRECVLSVYGSYSVIYTGAMPCPYRIQRGGVEVFACALASQASAWIGKQDDGFHLDDAQMGKLLAFAAEVGQ